MDIRVGAPDVTQVQATRPDRRELASDVRADPAGKPAVIVEVGRAPESAGTYNAKGVVTAPPTSQSADAALIKQKLVMPQAPAVRSEARAEVAATGGRLSSPEAVAMRSHPQVGATASAAPDRAGLARPKTSAPPP